MAILRIPGVLFVWLDSPKSVWSGPPCFPQYVHNALDFIYHLCRMKAPCHRHAPRNILGLPHRCILGGDGADTATPCPEMTRLLVQVRATLCPVLCG